MSPMRALVVVYSYHHMNTEKVARAIAGVIGADVRTPQQVDPGDVASYDLVGFGSGIYSARHHTLLLDLADRLPPSQGARAFIFSTSAMMGEEKVREDHSQLRERLRSRGYDVVDEFACKGYNTNSFLRFFGGMNKGHPDAEDLGRAEDFAKGLLGGRGT